MVKDNWGYPLIGLVGFTIILVVLIMMSPALGVVWLNHWYQQQGENYEFKVGNWQFSPFQTSLRLEGVELIHPGINQNTTKIDQVSLTLDWTSLLHKRVKIEKVTIDGLKLNLQEATEDGLSTLTIAGITLPASDTASSSSQDMESSSNQNEKWQFSLDTFELNHHELSWKLASLKQQGQLNLQKVVLHDFSTDLNQPLRLVIAASLSEFSHTTETQPQVSNAFSLKQPVMISAEGVINDVLTQPKWLGNLHITDLNLNVPPQTEVQAQSIEMKGMELDAQRQELGSIRLSEIGVVINPDFSIELAEYELNKASYEAGAVHFGQQAYSGLSIRFKNSEEDTSKTATQNSEASKQNTNSSEDHSDGQHSADGVNETLAIKFLGLNQIASENSNTRIYVRDESVTPVFNEQLTIYELKLAEMDGVLKQGDVATSPTKMNLVFGMDDYNRTRLHTDLGLTTLNGHLYPKGKVQLSTEQLNLVSFNGYLNRLIGYYAERGMVNLTANVEVEQAQLKGEITLLVKNAKFIPSDEDAIARISQQIAMPVETALDLLRDKNGNIRLTIPVHGDLRDPDFSLGDLTGQLSKLALQKSALFFISQSLQPYTMFVSLASYAGDYLFAIRLDTLVFEQKQALLTPEHLQRIDNIASIMQQKAELELSVCPFASEIEVQELSDTWSSLVTQRAQNIKAALAKVKDLKGESLASRITVCKPQKGEKAEVVLGIK